MFVISGLTALASTFTASEAAFVGGMTAGYVAGKK